MNYTGSELFELIIKSRGYNQASLSQARGQTRQLLSSKLALDTLRVTEFLECLDVMGLDFTVCDKKTGEAIILPLPGDGERLKGFSGGIQYDTSKACALSNDFKAFDEKYHNGVCHELYIDTSGRYFFAVYTNIPGAKNKVSATDEKTAHNFIKKFGKDIEAQKKFND